MSFQNESEWILCESLSMYVDSQMRIVGIIIFLFLYSGHLNRVRYEFRTIFERLCFRIFSRSFCYQGTNTPFSSSLAHKEALGLQCTHPRWGEAYWTLVRGLQLQVFLIQHGLVSFPSASFYSSFTSSQSYFSGKKTKGPC